MDAVTLGAMWLVGVTSGALTALGIVQIVSGRVFLYVHRDWSPDEARRLGWSRVVQGIALGIYSLLSGLTFGVHALPLFWAGHKWGGLVSAPFVLVFLGALLYQVVIDARHGKAPTAGHT